MTAKVTPRTWKAPSGETKRAWLLTYFDKDGRRHRKQFAKKGDAEAERVRVEGQLAHGVHVPDRDAVTVAQAAKAFLADFQSLMSAGKREKSTFKSYDRQVRLHLEPYAVAKVKLSRLTGPDCTQYARALEASLSDAMASRVFTLFRQIIKFAQGSGWIAANPADAVTIRTAGERTEGEAVYIPSKDDLRKLYEAAKVFDSTGQAEAIVSVLMFAGLRASELRGLPRRDLLLPQGKIRVTQRADDWQVIGPVKTVNSKRTIPVPSSTVDALRRWLKSAPASKLGLVFPTSKGARGEAGQVVNYHNLYNRLWVPLMKAAGLVDVVDEGEEKVTPHFALHALRHVAVSLWIEQGATPKQVTTWAGHASIQFTMDRYGHLWADHGADQAIAAAAQRAVIG